MCLPNQIDAFCDHCNGYGSSLKDPEGVDACTKCHGSGKADWRDKYITKQGSYWVIRAYGEVVFSDTDIHKTREAVKLYGTHIERLAH